MSRKLRARQGSDTKIRTERRLKADDETGT